MISSQDNGDIEEIADSKGKCLIHGEAASKNTHEKETPGSWTKPEAGWAKSNFDGSYSENEHRGEWVAVLRNNTCRVMLNAWCNIEYFPKCLNV